MYRIVSKAAPCPPATTTTGGAIMVQKAKERRVTHPVPRIKPLNFYPLSCTVSELLNYIRDLVNEDIEKQTPSAMVALLESDGSTIGPYDNNMAYHRDSGPCSRSDNFAARYEPYNSSYGYGPAQRAASIVHDIAYNKQPYGTNYGQFYARHYGLSHYQSMVEQAA